MADKRIAELNALTVTASTDEALVSDTSALETKKVTIENLFKKNFAYEINVDEIKNIPKIISIMDESFKLKIKNLDNFYEKYISNDKNPSKKAMQIISEILSK